MPEPEIPLMPKPVLYEDDTISLADGLVIDALPLSRGDHPVERYWRHPTSCEVVGGRYPWAPPAAHGSVPRTTKIGVDGFGTWRIRALLVTGKNSGSDADSIVWNEALTAMGARATHMHRPAVGDLETMLRKDLCQGINDLESVVLIIAGRASPVGGGSLLLNEAAVRYETLGSWLNEGCAAAASFVWVIDASYAGQFTDTYESPLPTLIWRASTATQPFAPRVSPLGGGLLSHALSQEIVTGAQRQCLGAFPSISNPGSLKSIHPSTTELWKVFRPTDLRDRMRTIRWNAVGIPAVADYAGSVDNSLYEDFKQALFEDIPSALRVELGEVTEVAQCSGSETCQLLHEGCDVGPCRAWACIGGQCQLQETPLAACDDGNSCTIDDVCHTGAICQGSVDPCSDGKPCTLDSCLYKEGCVHIPIALGGACNDGDPCTDEDVCDESKNCAGKPAECDDGDPCTGVECDALEGCTYEHINGPCDDDFVCTHQDYCKDGECFGVAIPCDDSNPCTLDTCDEELGTCIHSPAANGVACSDGDLCTTSDVCLSGHCQGSPKLCDDGLPCSIDGCDGGECIAIPPPATCLGDQGCVPVGESSPDNPCLVCSATNSWEALDGAPCPDDGVECTVDTCESGVCVHPNAPDTCIDGQGACVGVGESLGGCLTCVATGVAEVAGVGTSCDDGDPCTVSDVCSVDGLCQGAQAACCPVASKLSCGETVLGDTEFSNNLQSNWSCMNGFNFQGNEGVHTFVAECDGPVSVNVEALGGVGVLLVEGDADTCSQGECSAFSQSAATLQLSADQEIMVVVDSFGANGLYNLTVQCDCGD